MAHKFFQKYSNLQNYNFTAKVSTYDIILYETPYAHNIMTTFILYLRRYYLVDARFMSRSELFTPYRKERYHLKGIFKKYTTKCILLWGRSVSLQWDLRELHYGFKTQKKIIFAYYILHNYLMDVNLNDMKLAQVDSKLRDEVEKHHSSQENNGEIYQGCNNSKNVACLH